MKIIMFHKLFIYLFQTVANFCKVVILHDGQNGSVLNNFYFTELGKIEKTYLQVSKAHNVYTQC